MGQLATLVADAGKVTESAVRRLARRGWGKAFTFQSANEHLDVFAELLIHLIIDGGPPEEPGAGA
jgi:hypothetical protein